MLHPLFFHLFSRPTGSYPVCSGTKCERRAVLGRELITPRQLAFDETAYTALQQDGLCLQCQLDLRSHGAPCPTHKGWLARTEYEADFRHQPMPAGFGKISLFTLDGHETVALGYEE